jgi:hypothetical protein
MRAGGPQLLLFGVARAHWNDVFAPAVEGMELVNLGIGQVQPVSDVRAVIDQGAFAWNAETTARSVDGDDGWNLWPDGWADGELDHA